MNLSVSQFRGAYIFGGWGWGAYRRYFTVSDAIVTNQYMTRTIKASPSYLRQACAHLCLLVRLMKTCILGRNSSRVPIGQLPQPVLSPGPRPNRLRDTTGKGPFPFPSIFVTQAFDGWYCFILPNNRDPQSTLYCEGRTLLL